MTETDLDTLINKAMAAIADDRLEEAREILTQVVRDNPRHEQAWLWLSGTLVDLHEAIACLQRALALNPNNIQAQEWLAFAQQTLAKEDPLPAAEEKIRPVQPIGQYLVDAGLVSAAQLAAALDMQRIAAQSGQAKKIGQILVDQGVIGQQRLEQIVSDQQQDCFSLFWD